jgi:hypothetical protein
VAAKFVVGLPAGDVAVLAIPAGQLFGDAQRVFRPGAAGKIRVPA